MRAGTSSAAVLSVAGMQQIPQQEMTEPKIARPKINAWSAETFAEEQIRGLVQQVFSPALSPPVQQVVFSSIEPETGINWLCQRVGEVLAQERTTTEIAVVDESELFPPMSVESSHGSYGFQHRRTTSMLQFATRIHKSLWLVPSRNSWGDATQEQSLGEYMATVRREFEYSIVAAPPSAASRKALEIARFADGIILVLSAQRTRRITALKVKSSLAQVRLLGTILSEREFPIPTIIYRRL